MKRSELPDPVQSPVEFTYSYAGWYAQRCRVYGLYIPGPLSLGILAAIVLPGDAGTARCITGLAVFFASLVLTAWLSPRLVDHLDRRYEASQSRR
jgi:hypothetical protein